jgi:hypothetical protein
LLLFFRQVIKIAESSGCACKEWVVEE